jgi:hypothetical protein
MMITLLDLYRTPNPIDKRSPTMERRTARERERRSEIIMTISLSLGLFLLLLWIFVPNPDSHMANGLPLWGDAMPGKGTPS